MIANVLTSQKWCEPTSYKWNTFHESCLNESTHLKDWGPCGRFSFCQLGGIDQSPTIHIRVQETLGINVTFLYFEMLLIITDGASARGTFLEEEVWKKKHATHLTCRFVQMMTLLLKVIIDIIKLWCVAREICGLN